MTVRKRTPDDIEHRVLDRSRRRCALCIHFNNDWSLKQGQIAHLDHNPSNFAEDNLAFFCLPHHDDYDTKRQQTKNLTIREAKTARDRLYEFIETGGDLATAGQQTMRTPIAAPYLFEKRYKIYKEARELITYVIDHSRRKECRDSDLNKYYAILGEAPWFFPADVCTVFNNIISLTRQLVEGDAKRDRPTANIVVELDKIFDNMPKTFEHVMSFQ